MGSKSIMCYAMAREGRWQAVCLDFDLMVEGCSLKEVKERLNSMVISYIDDALAEAEPARSQLLNRRAPLHVRLAWKLPFLLQRYRNRDNESSVGFQVCHA